MPESSNGVVILITLLNILLYKLQKLQEAQQTNRLPLYVRQFCRRFSLLDIQWATNNFQDELVIGKGGFGKVYKGILDFGESNVAIKRLGFRSKQGIKEFCTEIEMLSKFQHSHLISLIGYCDDFEEKILVYEYMPNGTLADHLHKRVRKGDTSSPPLSWEQRLKICIGAAHGLDYLHTGTGIENRLIHRDVKTTNILLDENLAAKISDFGLSKTGPANQTCTYVSTRVKGTPGYLDPYYRSTHRLTRKTDVYAFGVVLFEVLCGRPAVDKSLDEEQINLAGWAQHCVKEGLLDQITDPYIKGNVSSDSINAFVDVAIKCLNSQPKHRPTMAEVVVALESALTLHEKSTHYSLVEIMPSDYTQEDVDLEVKNTNRNQEYEYIGEGIANFSNGWHGKNQSSARMTFTKRVSGLLSVTARAFLVNKDVKTSRYTPWNQEEVQKSLKLKSFTFKNLSVATRKFHLDRLLGRGGFGCVYRGWVDENTFAAAKWGTGMAIAVKRLDQCYQQWLTEINCLRTFDHPNVVKLIGYCIKKEHRLLVYEFIPQGSLEKHLFRSEFLNLGDSCSQPLSWNLRISIALGAAKGLAYIHKANVIHRDIKPSNILIDSNYKAKLCDFGLAREGPEDDRTHVTTLVMGTVGYIAPEYLLTGQLTMKSDIYNFGVVLLEILTGQSVLDYEATEPHFDLERYCNDKRRIMDVMDAHIEGQYTVREALKASSLALKCISKDPKLRPDANQVVKELEQLQNLNNSENITSEA